MGKRNSNHINLVEDVTRYIPCLFVYSEVFAKGLTGLI